MYVKQTFAIIQGETVKNDIVCDNYELANQLARSVYGEDAIAVESTQYPISVGDNYRDGVFYYKNSENVIPRQNTGEENALLAVEKVTELESDIASDNVDADYRLSIIELGLEV
jgi:hypothetical protein